MNICGDGIVVIKDECDDETFNNGEGCNGDCSGPLPDWECVPGDLTKPTNCSLITKISLISNLSRASSYLSLGSMCLTFAGSLSSGPGTFIIINALAISRSLVVFNWHTELELRK